MAGWGTGSFEKEDAVNWLGELHSIQPEDLQKILSHAADEADYLEAFDASIVIVVAEVMAALKGVAADAVPPEIIDWVAKSKATCTPDSTHLAIRAVEKVRRNSELKDLWLQAEGLNEWTASLQELQNRLAS